MPKQNYYLPQRRLVSQTDAALVATPRIPRSKFIGAWTRKTSFDAGLLVPILLDEVLPGDHMSYDVSAYVRMSTPLFPIFDNQRIDIHFFFTPCRILWNDWDHLMGSDDPALSPDAFSVPTVTLEDTDISVGSLYDHFGLPVEGQIAAANSITVNSLPFRAYNMIWNDWFRDHNLQAFRPQNPESDGPDDPTDFELMRRAKFHDYFTAALPWPQKFDTPTIPLGGNAPITGIGITGQGAGTNLNLTETGGAVVNYPNAQNWGGAGFFPGTLVVGIDGDPVTGDPQIFADLAAVSGVTIADFRQAMLLQELLERDARGGTRYIDIIKHHFGVNSPDARLQRPEYIGGGSTPLQITPIAQTAPTTGVPLGALGAAGTAAGQHRASYAATEHGYIIGLLSVRTELSYQQGLHRMWTRSNRYDFYWPTLSGLSEQAILQREIFCDGSAADENVWGYQERYQEYRTRLSEVTGIMRSGITGTLDAWHLAQEFAPAPALNGDFIADDPPMDRILAAGMLAIEQQYIADIMFRRTAVRPIPTFGVPASLTRF